ncbi:MAG: RNA-directed DNA polymerase, partial [bacterium]
CTLSDTDLLAWWPTMIAAYSRHARALHGQRCYERRRADAALQHAQTHVTDALARVAQAGPEQLPSTLAHATQARQALHDLESRTSTTMVKECAQSWLHSGERPSPLLTKLLQPPAHASTIPQLQDSNNQPLTTPPAIAERLVQHFASVSGPRVVHLPSQQAVLDSLRDQIAAGSVHCLPADLAEAAGAAEVSTEEVVAALTRCQWDSSPGPDGLPYTLWTLGGGVWAPLLARFFTAIARTGTMPTDFNLGVITSLLKPDAADPTQPSAYRPITLLNTLYRILAKVIAARFNLVMQHAIGPEQTAYLRGRLIGDNVAFTSLLPHVLHALGLSGALIIVDIAKAYDTVHREFAYSIMHTMGASAGLINWARLLLHDTRACARANGAVSSIQTWHAGVRQGCPLSPVLYLFVAQALASWLRSQPQLGITVDNRRYVSGHHSDDTNVALANTAPATLQALHNTFDTFSQASGQCIHPHKSKVLLLGPGHPYPAPPTLAGMEVVSEVRSLGIIASNVPPPRPPRATRYPTRATLRPPAEPSPAPLPLFTNSWAKRLTTANRCVDRVMRLPISKISFFLSEHTRQGAAD